MVEPILAEQFFSSDALDESFDRYARMVRRAIDVPVALVTIVEAARQVFIGAEGLAQPWQTTRETPLTHSFCQYVVGDAKPLVICDAREDPRLRTNLAIPDLGVVAYAGYPISETTGTIVGSLCAIDTQPRYWKPTELEALEDIAASCSTELSIRQLRQQALRAEGALRSTAVQLRTMLTLSNELLAAHSVGEVVDTVHRASAAHLGCSRASVWLREGNCLVLKGTSALAWAPAARGVVNLDADFPITRVVGSGQPLIYRDRPEQDAAFPAAAAVSSPGEARAFTPLLAHGEVIGCLVLVWPDRRTFDRDGKELLRGISAYTAQALDRVRLLEERTTVADTLQRALLSELPGPNTLQLAARYRAAAEHDEVGGDWYDAVIAPDGITHLVIGDVIGHDIRAASMMGQLRNMLRAFVWQNRADPPAANLARLDHALGDLQLRTIATVVLARIEQSPEQRVRSERTLIWSNAGHPPPLLVDPSGAVTVLDVEPADTLLGVLPERARRDHQATVVAGSTLLMYTDGLVENAATDIRDGIARVSRALARSYQLPLEQLLDTVLDEVAGKHDDDIAVMAVRFDRQL